MEVGTRRALLKAGLKTMAATAGLLAAPRVVGQGTLIGETRFAPSTVPRRSNPVRPVLLAAAMAALKAHGDAVKHDRIAIADFAAPSSQPRFHLLDVKSGMARPLLVAHGTGSDPDHSGWLQRFSNDFDSNATCEGAFVTTEFFEGEHGSALRLIGLDPTNSNAMDRAIIVHGAWYANPDMLFKWGKLGRSNGCFAVGEAVLADVLLHLGVGRMIYSAKI